MLEKFFGWTWLDLTGPGWTGKAKSRVQSHTSLLSEASRGRGLETPRVVSYSLEGWSYALAVGGFSPGDEFLKKAIVAHGAGDAGTGLLDETEVFFKSKAPFRSEAALGRGVQFPLDVGTFSPGPEFVVALLPGVLLIEGEPAALEAEVVGVEFSAAEAGDIGRELVEELPFESGIGFGWERAGEGGILEGGPACELFGERTGERGVAEFLFVVEAAGDFEGVLANEPIAMTGATPFGEVLFRDGPAGKLRVESGFYFRKAVEPFEDGIAGFAVAEAAVELLADFEGEPGDFAFAERSYAFVFHMFYFLREMVAEGVGQIRSNPKL